MELRQIMCCGVNEFYGFTSNTPENILMYIARERGAGNVSRIPFIIFTDVIVDNDIKTDAFVKYIKDNKLGKVKKTDSRRNPNSGNHIRVIVWQINKRGFRRWFEANR